MDSEGNRRGSAARSSVMGALLYGRRHSALQDGHVPGQCVPRRGSVLRATGNMCDPSFVMRPSCGPLDGVNGSGRGKATKKGRHGSLSLNGSERRTPRTEARTQHQSVEFAPTRGAPQSQTSPPCPVSRARLGHRPVSTGRRRSTPSRKTPRCKRCCRPPSSTSAPRNA